MSDVEVQANHECRDWLSEFFSEPAMLPIVFFHLFPATLILLIEANTRPVATASMVVFYFALRIGLRFYSPKAAITGYFLLVGLWQLFMARLAFVVSPAVWFAILALFIGHYLLRRKKPDSRLALMSVFLAPLPAFIAGQVNLRIAVVTVAITALGLPLFALAKPRKIRPLSSALFFFALGWTCLFGGFYWADPDDRCGGIGQVDGSFLMENFRNPQAWHPLRNHEVNLVEPGCLPGQYLIGSRKDGLFFLGTTGKSKVSPPIHDGQAFGMVRDCEAGRIYAVSWEKGTLLAVNTGNEKIEWETAIGEDRPDGLVAAGDELVAVNDTRSDVLVLNQTDGRIKRTYKELGQRTIAYDPQRDRIFVVHNWHVVAADRKTGQEVASRFVGSWEIRFCADIEGRRLFVVSFFTGLLFELDLDDLSIRSIHRVPLGSRYVLYEPGRDQIFTANFIAGKIDLFDGATFEHGGSYFTGIKPRRLRLDQEGNSLLIGTACGAFSLPLPSTP